MSEKKTKIRNRFMQETEDIDFDDPVVLTSIPPVKVNEVQPAVTVAEKHEKNNGEEQQNTAIDKKIEDVVKPAEGFHVTEEPVNENSIIDLSDPFAGLKEEKKRGKSYTFYLDDEVVAALEKLAKQKKINKSKALNTLMRNILLK